MLVQRTAVFAAAGLTARAVGAALLPLAALADAVENTLHLWLTAAPRFGADGIYAAAAAAATLKWAAIAAFGAWCAVALARR